MYQMNLFLDTPVRPTKKEKTQRGFQAYALGIFFVFFFFGLLFVTWLIEPTRIAVSFAFFFGIVFGWLFQQIWPDFFLYTLLYFPKIKDVWRNYRPIIRRFAHRHNVASS